MATAILKAEATIRCCIPGCEHVLQLPAGTAVLVGPAGIVAVCVHCEAEMDATTKRRMARRRHPCVGCGKSVAMSRDLCIRCNHAARKEMEKPSTSDRRCAEFSCRKPLEGNEGVRTGVCRSCYRRKYRREHRADTVGYAG